jgi:putative PIN family toxin of toxin-antitoxin system
VRAVADTNVYISALNFGGTPGEILAHGRSQAILLFVSPSILQEIERVLLSKFQWSAARTRQAISSIREFAQLAMGDVTSYVS